jgi:hypothetical protein
LRRDHAETEKQVAMSESAYHRFGGPIPILEFATLSGTIHNN